MTQIIPAVDNSNTLGLYASFEQWVVTQDAYIAISNVHKDPLQRNEQGQYVHHGIRLAFQAFTLSHSVHQLGYAATEAAETFRQMAKMFELFRDVDLTDLGKSIKELTRLRVESSPATEPPEYIEPPAFEVKTHG